MRFMFIVQGEGRGHLTQAMTMERMLRLHGHEVVMMMVGKSPARKLPSFFTQGVSAPVTTFDTLDFRASAQGKRPDVFRTIFGNLKVSSKFAPSIDLIRRAIRASEADVVVNFYELLGTLGWISSGRHAPMVVVGHQSLLRHRHFGAPMAGFESKPALDFLTHAIERGASKILALSFRPMASYKKLVVVPPLLRPEVLSLRSEGADSPLVRRGDYILGYMLNAGFSSEVMKWHGENPGVPLRFFWDDMSHGAVYEVDDTLTFYYLDDKEFVRQMAGCGAYASTAGFESICEAMYLGKPLMMVPTHIEQKCNAFDATRNGAALSSDEFDLTKLMKFAGLAPDGEAPNTVLSRVSKSGRIRPSP